MKYFDGFIAENDGYGIVGYSFHCPYCEKFNRFVDEEKHEQECEFCGNISKHPNADVLSWRKNNESI